MRRLLGATPILYLAALLSLIAAWKARTRLEDQIRVTYALQEETRRLETHGKALIGVLNEQELTSPFLSADVVVGGGGPEIVLDPPTNVVLYRLSTRCRYCPANYGFLNELAASGVPVIGLAVDLDPSSVERHRAEWGVRFPVLVHAHGSAVDLVPRYGTPTLVVFSEGRIALLEFGELTPEVRIAVRATTTRWMGHPQSQ